MGLHYGLDDSSNNYHPLAYLAIYNYLKGLGGGAEPFAIHKVIQGTTYLNPDTAIDVAGFRGVGLRAQAGYLMDQGNASPAAELAVYRAHTDLPLTKDIELPEGLTVAQYIAHSNALQSIAPGIDYLNQAEVTEGFPDADGLWLAEYNGLPGTTSHPCLIHQYTSTGTIPGARGAFDLNVWLGTDAEFLQFFSLAPSISAPIKGGLMSVVATDPTTGGTWATDANGGHYNENGAPFVGALTQHPDWKAGGAESGGTAPCVGVAAVRTGKVNPKDGSDWGVIYFVDTGSPAPDGSPHHSYKFNRDGSF